MTESHQGHEGHAHEKFFIGFLAELDNSKAFGKKNFFAFFGLFGLMKAKKKKKSLNTRITINSTNFYKWYKTILYDLKIGDG